MRLALPLTLLALIALCLSPLPIALLAESIANAQGCRLDEAGRYPCIINGKDWGGVLGAAFLLPWIMLVTIPVALGLAALLALVLLIRALRYIRARKGS